LYIARRSEKKENIVKILIILYKKFLKMKKEEMVNMVNFLK